MRIRARARYFYGLDGSSQRFNFVRDRSNQLFEWELLRCNPTAYVNLAIRERRVVGMITEIGAHRARPLAETFGAATESSISKNELTDTPSEAY